MIDIRPAKFTECDIIVDFQMRLAHETEGLKLNKDELTKGVEAVFGDAAKGTYFIAEDNEQVIACLLTTSEWSEWRNGTVVWIQSVYVRNEFRGKGVFKTMYSHIKKMVKQEKALKGIRLYVDKTNVSAQRVYEAIGMNGDHYHFFEWMKGGI